MSANPGQDDGPSTPSKSQTKSSSTFHSQTLNGALRLLALNGMHMESPYDLYEMYPQVVKETSRLLVDRDSEKKRNRDTSELVTAIRDFGRSNERTLCAKVMPLLQGRDRSVEQQVREGESKTVRRAWSMDRLGENWDVQFRIGTLPILRIGDPLLDRIFEKALQDLPKLKIPKPDVLYGPWEDAFTEEERAVNEKFIESSSISELLFHPAFVWEWKSSKSNPQEGEVQACRGAAAMGHAIREFQKSLKVNVSENIVDDIDTKSIVYAMCIDNRNAYMHAGFYKRKGNSFHFHMIQVRQYPLVDPMALSNLRADVHNILDWIVGERLQWIKGMIGNYIKSERQILTGGALSMSTGQAASLSGSPPKKKMRTRSAQDDASDNDELA